MKRIILTTFVFLALIARAQTYTIINSPDPVTYTAISNVNAPNGQTVHTTFNAVYFVDFADLAIPSASIDISSFGFAYTSTLLLNPASGTLTVYLSNTTDPLYNKGTSWTTAINGMTQVFSGILNIPTGTVETNVDFNFPVNFNYNGAGLYVAFSYTGNTFETDYNYTAYNKCMYTPPLPTNTLGVTADSYFYTDLNDMHQSLIRPVFRFGLAYPSTGVNEMNLETDILLYPNPCSGNLKLVNATGNEIMQFVLYDVSGRKLMSEEMVGERMEVKLDTLNPGIYFAEMSIRDKTLRKKLIIE